MDQSIVIGIDHLTIRYGHLEALHDITVEVPLGAVGLLGPNGAGKTTLFRTLMGFINPTAGGCRVFDHPVHREQLAVRRILGYMPETENLIPGMNAVSFLVYAGQLSGMPRSDALERAHETLYYAGLGEVRYRPLQTYSTGMKQRLKLAQALIHGPRLLLLDEPTSGMDPDGRLEILDLIRDLARNKGVGLVLSSHLLPDVEYACDHVIVLRQGRIATAGPVEHLRAAGDRAFDLRLKGERERFVDVAEDRGVRCRSHAEDSERVRVFLAEGAGTAELFQLAVAAGTQVRGLTRARSTLEDVYVEAMTAAEHDPTFTGETP